MPAVRGGVRGDHLVSVRIAVPAKLGKRERELLEEFARAGDDEDSDRTFFDRVKEAFKAE
jgi:molecular chaperone DnaJ